MKKETITIFRYRRLPRRYGWTSSDKPTEEDILNKVLEFSKGKDIKIYRHLVRKDWKENKHYKPEFLNGERIPRGDEIWNLVIYYQ